MTSQLTSVNYSNISLQYVTRNGLLIRAGFTVTLATNLSLLREWDSISSLVRELKELKTLSIYEIKINTTQAQTFQPISKQYTCCNMNATTCILLLHVVLHVFFHLVHFSFM